MEKRKESRNKKVSVSLKKIFVVSLQILFFLFTSCEFFENDVADFMEKYTETAAIETHEFSVETFNDAKGNLCISSEKDTEISFYMRNPKKFELIPSVVFNNLGSQFSTSSVDINQIDSNTMLLSLPQDFLVPVDEGQDITAEIRLYEPMSGRDFDRYTLPLKCNTKPPLIQNPTIINNNNNTFVVAFDMPNDEECAVRHKDISEIEINGKSYPISVSTIDDPDSINDPDTGIIKLAQFTFSDSHFSRTWDSTNYKSISGKTFDPKRNSAGSYISVYYETGDAFFAGDKQYTITLKDSAGLTSTVTASTSISKLEKPVILNMHGGQVAEDGLTSVPFNEDTEKGKITIIPPTRDHLGNSVSGVTVYYKVYEATGRGRIYTSGTTTVEKTIELPLNTYRVEAYAELVSYENSATTAVKFRFMNNVLFVNENNPGNGDGSETAPYATIAEAIEDINQREQKENKFTIYIDGNLNEDVLIGSPINTDKLIIAKRKRADNGVIKCIRVESQDSANPIASDFELTIGDVTVTNDSGIGIEIIEDIKVELNGTKVIDGSETGIEIKNTVPVTMKNVTVSGNSGNGIIIDNGATCNFEGGIVSENKGDSGNGIKVSDGVLNFISGTITKNKGVGIYLDDGNASADITTCSITDNDRAGIYIKAGKTCSLSGGTISGNKDSGIEVRGTLNISGNIIVQNNTTGTPAESCNVKLGSGKVINVTGPLASTSKIWVKTATAPTGNTKTAITSGYGAHNSRAPAYNFFSDIGYGIILEDGEVNISQSQGSIFTQFDYTVDFAPADGSSNFDTIIDTKRDKVISVIPVIKRSGVDITNTIPAGDLTWNIFVTCHQDVVVTSNTNSIRISKNILMDDVYYVHINLTYMNRVFDQSIRLASEPAEIKFESYSIADLKTLVESLESDTVIAMSNGVTVTDRSGTTINVKKGVTVTLKRSDGYTGSLVSAGTYPKELRINTEHSESGTLVLDGGWDAASETGIIATAPLMQDNCGSGNIWNVVFQNTNYKNGNGGAVKGGSGTNTSLHNCQFINCWANNGGAGYFQSNMHLDSSCRVENCYAYSNGGGFYLTAANNHRDSTIGSDDANMREIMIGCKSGSNKVANRVYIYRGNWNIILNGTTYRSSQPIE